MKKTLCILAAMFAFADFSNSTIEAMAQNNRYPAVQTVTIKQAKSMPNNAWVTVQGTITEKKIFDDDKYTIKDSSDEMTVEIDDDFGPVTIGAKYEITGEIDTDWSKPIKLEAKSIKIIQ